MSVRLKLYTGPCGVSDTADILRFCGASDLVEGTAHVYFTMPQETPTRAYDTLYALLGSTYTAWIARDVGRR